MVKYLLIFLILGLILFPLYIMLKISLSAPADIFQQNPPYSIQNFTSKHFSDVINSGETFLSPLKKSLAVALMVSLLSLLIATPAAYGISRFDYRLRYFFLLAIFATRMIPEVSIALPISIAFIKMGFFDTIMGLVLAHLIKVLPVVCFILISVFGDFPEELEQQACIDGCSKRQTFMKIVLPLSITGVSVAGIFSFLFSWDEFIYASYLSLAEPTMPLKMFYYVDRGNIFYSSTYAIIITIPVLILTFLLQKYLKPEYLSGAIKG